MGLLGAALTGDEDADALDHLGRRAGAFGEEDVGGAAAIEACDRAGDDHGRQRRVELFGATDELVAVHLRHLKIAQEKIEGAGDRLLDDLEGMISRDGRDDAVAASFQQEGADRESLFVVVYAEDRLLGPQSNVSILPVGRRNNGSG